jgi:hypothetical protein
MEIHDSARKHGILDEDIRHAVEEAVAEFDLGDDQRVLYLGFDCQGANARSRRAVARGRRTHRDPCHADPQELPATTAMTEKKTYGRTKDGRSITDELIQEMADEAEAGYDPEELRPRGRPSLSGEGRSPVVQVRLDRALRGRLDEAAEREQATPSEIVRRALDAYLS